MGKPTVHDIAKEAGVSLATVDRVLNKRPGVRERTVERVQKAVETLGYVRDVYAANLARGSAYRFAFVLPEGPSLFVATLREALVEAAEAQAADRVTTKMITVPVADAHAAARVIDAIDPAKFDGVALMAQETPQVRDAVAHLKQCGLAVVALVSDLPSSARDRFVGINSIQAGRTAGTLIGRLSRRDRGKVLVVTNSLTARDSVERRLGFDAKMSEEFPGLDILPTVEAFDDRDRMRRIVQSVAETTPDLVAVYSMGSGARPLLQGLRASGRLGDLAVVAHELTAITRAALIDGEIDAVIRQNVGHLARSALRVLRAKCDGAPVFEDQEKIRIDIVIRENLP